MTLAVHGWTNQVSGPGKQDFKSPLLGIGEKNLAVFKPNSCNSTHFAMRQRENVAVLKLNLHCIYVQKNFEHLI